jgi:hypothetical protein
MTNVERIDKLERSLSALLTWLTLALGKREALRIKAILEDDETDLPTKL